MTKQTILLIYGGKSSEHGVSVMSARNVYEALNKQKYDVILCYISRSAGTWNLVDSIDSSDGPVLQPLLGKSKFTADGREIGIDVVIPMLHGKNGEDGAIQGLLNLVDIPYVGCGVEAGALCMDKAATKRISRAKTAKWMEISESQLDENKTLNDQILETLGAGPWFVKPSRAGSSVGVTKVTDIRNMESALSLAHQHDAIALIEEAIEGRELEVAILGNPPHHTASAIGEVISGADFYDYDDKYSDSSESRVVIAPDLPTDINDSLRRQACDIYERMGCIGLARVDFFLTKQNEIYMNEINTMPGFTNISMYPKLWQHEGLSYEKLLDTLVEAALNKHIA